MLLHFLTVLLLLPTAVSDIATAIHDVRNIDVYRAKTLHKILSLRKPDFSWSEDNSYYIPFLQVANPNWAKENPQTIEHLDVALLSDLIRDHPADVPLDPRSLALFVFSLLATCRDPRDFQQYNLLDKLKSRHTHNPFQLGYAILALCLAGENIDQDKMEQMTKDLHEFAEKGEIHHIARGTTLLQAAECLIKRNPDHEIKDTVNEVVNHLKRSQHPDGGFGSIYTTADVMQALVHANDDLWNATAAMHYLLSTQHPDGSFGDKLTTGQVYQFMYGDSYLDLMNFNCNAREKRVK